MIRLYCTFIALVCIAAASNDTDSEETSPAPDLPPPTNQTVGETLAEDTAVNNSSDSDPVVPDTKPNGTVVPITATLGSTTAPSDTGPDTEAVKGNDGAGSKNTVDYFCFVATIGLILLTNSCV